MAVLQPQLLFLFILLAPLLSQLYADTMSTDLDHCERFVLQFHSYKPAIEWENVVQEKMRTYSGETEQIEFIRRDNLGSDLPTDFILLKVRLTVIASD